MDRKVMGVLTVFRATVGKKMYMYLTCKQYGF